MLSILIADDHSVVRRGLKQILLDEFFSANIGEACNADDIFKMMPRQKWDIVISDISMPGKNGLEILQQLKELYPAIPVLILSIYPEDQYAMRVMKAGAFGYLNKDSAPEELIKAVRCVLLGKRYVTYHIVEKLALNLDKHNDKPIHESLSDREFEVMKLLASGKTVGEVANILSLSINTVSTYRTRILSKMSFAKNADLTIYAIENKLI